MKALELWAGIECTVNRVGGARYSQLARSGHLSRAGDLELIAELGIRTLRYPVLWDQCTPGSPDESQWHWAENRLNTLKALGIEPILGLIHHGSGPAGTTLIDDSFAPGLAAHAAHAAALFPWVEQYTPVNEPLTTARFSGLYGHWYPHARDDRVFARALINQCRATVLSMRAVRRVNSDAKLVQTEDLGTTYGTAQMHQQVEFDNHRRWLTWDLLCGKVTMRHPLWRFLLGTGIKAAELDWFAENPCPPQMIGVNHYVTSDRFLDERLSQYPEHLHGTNGHQRYADVDAVRVLSGRYRGWEVLEQAAHRYALPIAVTEVHLGCSREEQLRWLEDAWCACQEARLRGYDIRALTAWAAFGSFGWDSLLTRPDGQYEAGVFDVRAPRPRPTAIAHRLRELSHGADHPGHPVLASEGWWQTDRKLSFATALREAPPANLIGSKRRAYADTPPLLIFGTGTLGHAFARECERRGLLYRLLARSDVDVCDGPRLVTVLDELRPWALINATGYVRVDDAECEVAQCFQDNCEGTRALADLSGRRGLPLLTFSTDLVFDGTKSSPYVESDPVNPLNAYGRSKAAGETAALILNSRTLCVRTAAFFGYWAASDYLARALALLDLGELVRVPRDVVVSPTYVPELVGAAMDLFIDNTCGIWHLANAGAISWADCVRRTAMLAGVAVTTLETPSIADLGRAAVIPRNSALRSERGWIMRPLDDALEQCAEIAKTSFLPQRRAARHPSSLVA